MQDYPEILTDTGYVKLEKNSVHLLRRSDAEPLIKIGILVQTER